MTRLALGSAAAAVAMFLWGFVFWAAGLGAGAVQHGANDEALQRAFAEHVPATGVYNVPDMEGRARDAYLSAFRKGPVAMVFVRKEGGEPMSAATFAAGFAHYFVVAFLIGLLIRRLGPGATPGGRTAIAAWAGLTAAIWSQVNDPIWFYHPWAFHLWSMLYDIVAWTLAGAIVGRFLEATAPRRSAATV